MRDFFGKDADTLNEKKLYLFDMDGTIYIDNKLFDGTKKLLEKIKSNGAKYCFITNNSSKSVSDYVKKLSKMGIEVCEDNFFTSAQAMQLFLNKNFPNQLIYAQGTSSFIDSLVKSGVNVTVEFNESAKAVVVGYDSELTGEKLFNTSKMLTLIKNIPYFATNPDWCCPVDFGYVPDCGSMCFGLEKATGRKPVYLGKPEPLMINIAMSKFGVKKEETVVFGDRLYTDIAAGINAGVDTVLVLSGEATLDDYTECENKPSYVFNSIKDLI